MPSSCIEAGENFSEAFEVPLEVVEKTQHTRLSFAFELHYR